MYAAVAAVKNVVKFCANSGPVKGLKEVDVAHNIGAAAREVIKCLTILRDNADCEDLNELFTWPENTPTPAVSAAHPSHCKTPGRCRNSDKYSSPAKLPFTWYQTIASITVKALATAKTARAAKT